MNQQIAAIPHPHSIPSYDIEDNQVVYDQSLNNENQSTHSTPSTMLQHSHESTPLSNMQMDDRTMNQDIGLPC
jgi:hypothetical protein